MSIALLDTKATTVTNINQEYHSMTRLNIFLALLLLCTVLCSTSPAATPQPAGGPSPAARDKCPVCGMFVAKFPDWVASSRFKDGTVFYFDGPKDMFSHYFDTSSYTPGRRQADITSLLVKEYYSLKYIDARSAFYVINSDVYGPMGKELVPFANQKDAAAFMADHKGKQILRFNEITRQIVKSLN